MDTNKFHLWITGASSGIGEALVYEYAPHADLIIISARNQKELERVQAKASGQRAQIKVVPLDLEKYETLQNIATTVLNEVHHIDLLINNGGISQRSLAIQTSIDVDKKLMDVNFLGTIALTKAVLPSMIKRNQGQIATVTSLVGKFGTPLRSTYSASKHALHGFFDSLRVELADTKISISMVLPGFIKTNVSLNAMTQDGSKQGSMDKQTGEGMEPELFAKILRKRLQNKEHEIMIGKKEVMAVYLKRLSPALLHRVLSKVKVT